MYSVHQHLAYSVWANEKLVSKLKTVNKEVLYTEVKSSFTSIAKTLLHMWDAEVVWLNRFNGISLSQWPSQDFKGNEVNLLDGIIKSSVELFEFVASKEPGFLESKISYRNLKGEPYEDFVEPLLYHIVNHGTYHRGQITTILRELGILELPGTDIILYMRSLKSKN